MHKPTPPFLKFSALAMAGLAVTLAVALAWGIYQKRQDNLAMLARTEGWKAVEGTNLVITAVESVPCRYTADMVSLMNGADAPVALINCATGEIRGRVKGGVMFIGRCLTIAEGAVVEGDLETGICHTLNVYGSVQGAIKGPRYIHRTSPPPALPPEATNAPAAAMP